MSCIAGALVFGIYSIFFSSYFTVQNITVERNNTTIPATELAPFLNRIKGRNALFVHTEDLMRDIEQKFKFEVKLARIQKKFPNHLSLLIEEYPRIAKLNVITDGATKSFAVNEIGYAIPATETDAQLPVITLRNPANPQLYKEHTVVISKEFLDKFDTSFKTFLTLFDLGIEYGEWLERAREFHLKSDKGFFVWLDLTQDIEDQLKKLKRAQVKLDIYNEPLEYIDLRIAGSESEKVIFKRK